MDMRELKALEIAARSRITFSNGVWVVPSQSSGAKYSVTIGSEPSCTCEDFQLRKLPCKHVLAARLVCARDHNGQAPAIVADAVPKRPTYPQAWPLYNKAQQTEKHRFCELLSDLCQGVEEPPASKVGRRRTPMADMVFAACYKVYTTVSSRRFACDLKDAHEKGYLSMLMNSVSVGAFLESDLLTPALTSLITRSSLPLRAVETTFAPDSTGFSSSRFVRWFDEKYGVERSGHDWVKAHAMCGVKTNVVTAVEIHGRDAGDSPLLPAMLNTTAASGFTVKQVTADKGYSSVENVEAIVAAGAEPYIPFKSNATGAAGGLWGKMFHFYSYRRDEFLKHYHQRSNVESTFSMVKAKFRDHVRSKTDTAMKNEVLCKFLAHNICVVHQSHVELGIEPEFWRDEPTEVTTDPPAVLPFARPG